MSDNHLHLNFLIIGDTMDGFFSVKIDISENVYTLKRAIKCEELHSAFRDLDLDQFALYCTSEEVAHLDDDELIQALKIPVEEGRHRKLLPQEPLSQIFNLGDSHPTKLHILVKLPYDYKPLVAVPDVIVNCLVHGYEPNQMFSVEISGMKTVTALKDAIKSRMPVWVDAVAYELALYNVSLPWDENTREELKALNLDHVQLLEDPLRTLSDINFPPKYLHIVVDAPLSMRSRPRRELSGCSLETEGVESQRNLFLEYNPPMPPSSAGKVQDFSTRQNHEYQAIYCNRPHTAQATIPPTLLHPVFGQFLDDCETLEVTPEDNSLALGLHIAMSSFYTGENERAIAVRDEFSKWGLNLVVSKTPDGFETDGDISVKDHRFVISVIKNEVCSTGAEPYSQAILYYLEFTRDFAGKLRGSSLPCMILLAVGSSISFAGAVWNVRPVVQTLSSALPMHYHPTDSDMQIQVARHLGAFKKAVNALEQHYRDLPSGFTSYPPQSQLFPYCTSFKSLQNNVVQHFKYISQPFDEYLIFFATLSNQRPICIKFARRYSKAAHGISASLGHAPALHGFEKIPGGWLMIVMDKLPDEYTILSGSTLSSPLINEIRKHIGLLHQRGYVHGDIRNSNIMVPRSDRMKFMLIDFEWAGKNGEVRYPMNVNKGPMLWRPDGAVDGALILPEHDIDMLDHIITWNDLNKMEG